MSPHIPLAQLGAEGIPQFPDAQLLPAAGSIEAAKEENNFLLSADPQEGHSIFSELFNDL
ncbi:MAG: hypothetical protein A2068_12005 [Ignavibacteria bacterium GWB2_35_6b]|nr:MAG: hypothetical protein A2068_12005 [Ignavibacteria bacterium GWB2_35_6b]